jgi:hypothetical protein
MSRKELQNHKENIALSVIEDNPDASREEMRDKFHKQMQKVTIHKIRVFIDANKHWARSQGATINNPELVDDVWKVRVSGKHPVTDEVGHVMVEFEKMDELTDDDVFQMLGKAVHQIVMFKQERRLIKPKEGLIV